MRPYDREQVAVSPGQLVLTAKEVQWRVCAFGGRHQHVSSPGCLRHAEYSQMLHSELIAILFEMSHALLKMADLQDSEKTGT